MSQRTGWILAILLAPLLAIGGIILSGNTIGPFSQIATMFPWNQPMPEQAWDILQADGVIQFFVWRDLVFSSWREGVLPSWNPYQFAGTPLLANSQSAALYPLHWLFSPLPTGIAINLLAWFHLALAGLGVRHLALRLGANSAGAGFAAIAFTLSPFMISWSVLPSVITTCAYIPWVIALTIGIFQSHRPSGPWLAICIGLMLLAGHLQFAFYGILATVFTGLFLSISQTIQNKKLPFVPILISLLAGILGVALSLPQLLPVREYSQYSHRQGSATEEGYSAYTSGAVKPFELVSIVAPGFMGAPGVAETSVKGDFPYPTYWPQFVKPGANYAESAVALGPAVILGLLLLRRKLNWKLAGLAAGLAAIGILLAAGSPLNAALYFGVPGFSATGSPGRASVLFVLGACVLAGIAISQTRPETPEKNDYLPLAGLGIIVVLSLAIANSATSLQPWIPGIQVAPQIATRFLEVVPILILTTAFCALAWYLLVRKQNLTAGVAVLLVSHVLISQIGIIPSGTLETKTQPFKTAQTDRVAFINQAWDFTRAAPAIMPPNTASLFRIHDIAGYDSLIHKDTVRILKEINSGADPAPPVNGNILYVKPEFDLNKLKEAGVTKIIASTPIENSELVWQEIPTSQVNSKMYVAETGGPGILQNTNNDAKLIQDKSNSIKIEATGSGQLTYRTRNLPGWSAEISGKPTPILPGDWLTVEIPNGLVEVTFKYKPPGFEKGLMFGILAILVLAAWIPISIIKQKDINILERDQILDL